MALFKDRIGLFDLLILPEVYLWKLDAEPLSGPMYSVADNVYRGRLWACAFRKRNLYNGLIPDTISKHCFPIALFFSAA